MPRTSIPALLGSLALAACGEPQQAQSNQPAIKVTSTEQQQLHKLAAFDLAIGLKRAIYAAGYSCKRVTDAGFVGTYKNLDMWAAHCVYDKGQPRDWAIFAGPDGSAQVRDCRDIPGTGLPECKIVRRPEGSFAEMPGG
jgi:hypothetical protein